MGVGAALAGVGIGTLATGAGRAIAPGGPEVITAEESRPRTGQIVRRELRARPQTIDLGGREVETWAYGESIPGQEVRLQAGDQLQVRLSNDLPGPTTIHWHGLALRNDMDGVPGLTMAAIEAGQSFDYAFTVPDPGTYWFHPHVGVTADTGLSAPLIVEDPAERVTYDEEAVLVLDDWTDGWGDGPAKILARMKQTGMPGMGGMDHGGMAGMGKATKENPLGADTGDVTYPAHLINGRLPGAPFVVKSKPGRRIRFRLINAGSDTAYRFAIGGHRLTVTHTDGFPVEPVTVDALVLGMGERYDVVVRVGDGVFPIVAVAEGKSDPAALALLRSASGPVPEATVRPAELSGRMLGYGDLRAAEQSALRLRAPDRELSLSLTMANGGRQWLINGEAYGEHSPLPVESGERVRLMIKNNSMMFHPMHLHGHTFALVSPDDRGPRKDTVNVLPMQQLQVDVQTDNPGQWLVHCHNTYHGELGMMTTLSYTQ